MKSMKNLKKLFVFVAIMAIFTFQTAVVFAVDEDPPPTIYNPFGDDVEASTTPPSLQPGETDDPGTTTTTATTTTTTTPTPGGSTPTPTPNSQTTPLHSSPDLPNNGPGEIALLSMIAFSLAGGYLYRLKKEEN